SDKIAASAERLSGLTGNDISRIDMVNMLAGMESMTTTIGEGDSATVGFNMPNFEKFASGVQDLTSAKLDSAVSSIEALASPSGQGALLAGPGVDRLMTAVSMASSPNFMSNLDIMASSGANFTEMASVASQVTTTTVSAAGLVMNFAATGNFIEKGIFNEGAFYGNVLAKASPDWNGQLREVTQTVNADGTYTFNNTTVSVETVTDKAGAVAASAAKKAGVVMTAGSTSFGIDCNGTEATFNVREGTKLVGGEKFTSLEKAFANYTLTTSGVLTGSESITFSALTSKGEVLVSGRAALGEGGKTTFLAEGGAEATRLSQSLASDKSLRVNGTTPALMVTL
ncbi:MAG TPA: hypothetical protein PKZ41_06580, partial [Candidatus Omnitrophota bacterium]|nr:hypothetical protein [Candidatus Omnitrophota bacterium]